MGVWEFLTGSDKSFSGSFGQAVKNIFIGETAAERQGNKGERKVSRITNWTWLGTKAVLLRNLYLPWPDGKTSQIDELVIADSGIYVIEVKNYKGWIFGNESHQYWMQVLPDGYTGKSLKNRLYNPVRQNASHISCVRKLLPEYEGPFHSLIVFGDNAEFKDLTVSPGTYVIHSCELSRTFRGIDSRYDGILGKSEIDRIRAKLERASASADRKSHVSNIGNRKSEQEFRRENGLCPYCVAPLVLRTARKGLNAGSQFLGCSRYPQCKYTCDIR